MRKIKKITLFILIVTLAFIGLHVFINLKGRDILAAKMQEVFQRKVHIASLSTSFPLDLRLKGVEVEGLFKINEVVAKGGMIDLMHRNFRLSYLKMTRPQLYVERNYINKPAAKADLIPNAALAPKEQNAQPAVASAKADIKPIIPPSRQFPAPKFSIGRFIVSSGVLNFTDKATGGKELQIKVKDLNLKIINLDLQGSSPQVTSFELRGKMPWRQGQKEGKIKAEGWIDLAKKNMKATLAVTDIDGIYLYPYYSQWVDLEKARIESAKLNFTSNITSTDNNLAAACHLELTDIVRKPRRAPEELSQKEERVANAIIDTFKEMDQGRIILDFTYRTKMDRPKFSFGVVSMAFKNKLDNGLKDKKLGVDAVVKVPVRLAKGTVKGAADISKAAVAGTTGIFGELKKALQAAFTREPKEKDY